MLRGLSGHPGNLLTLEANDTEVRGVGLVLVLALAPADGLVPPAPGSAPAPGPAPAPGSARAPDSAPAPSPAPSPDSALAPSPAPGPNPPRARVEGPSTIDRVREAAQVREAARGKEPPPAPDPDPATNRPAEYEIGGFLKRPPPSAPRVESADEEGHSDSASFVWGVHRPVARWKRDGLIGSGVLTGIAIGTAIGSRVVGQRRLNEVGNYLDEAAPEGHGSDPITACRLNAVPAGNGTILVDDVGLANRCQRFDRMRVTRAAALGLSVVGILSTVTFGVLHLVHRPEEPRRVEARRDGVAVRF